MSNLEIYKKFLLGTTFKTDIINFYQFQFGYIVDEHHVYVYNTNEASLYSLSDVFYKIDVGSWVLETVVERKLKLYQIKNISNDNN